MRINQLSSPVKSTPKKQPSLVFCLLFDFIGYASYSVPFLGELLDIIWAPISALCFFFAFGGWRGGVGGIFNFIEELLPGTDFVPSFTIMWFIRNAENRRLLHVKTV